MHSDRKTPWGVKQNAEGVHLIMGINKKAIALTAMFLFIVQTGRAYAMPVYSPVNSVYAETSANMELEISKRLWSRGSDLVTVPEIDYDSIQAYAREFIGCRYVYGASGPNKFDCSGFTMYVFNHFGINLPHSASAQSSKGISIISKEELMTGDLVFFKTSGLKRITHVGMYLSDGEFIHSASKGVMVNSLDEAYYKKRYVTASRVIN